MSGNFKPTILHSKLLSNPLTLNSYTPKAILPKPPANNFYLVVKQKRYAPTNIKKLESNLSQS